MKLSIIQKKAIRQYPSANESQKRILEKMFGEKLFTIEASKQNQFKLDFAFGAPDFKEQIKAQGFIIPEAHVKDYEMLQNAIFELDNVYILDNNQREEAEKKLFEMIFERICEYNKFAKRFANRKESNRIFIAKR